MKRSAFLAFLLLLSLAGAAMAQLPAENPRGGPAELLTPVANKTPALPDSWLPGSQKPLFKACTGSCLTSCARQNDQCYQMCEGDFDCQNVCSDSFLWCQCGCCNWLC